MSEVTPDVVITRLSVEEALNEGPAVKCAIMMQNKMGCPKKALYKRVSRHIDRTGKEALKTDYLCENHYQLLISTKSGAKYKVKN